MARHAQLNNLDHRDLRIDTRHGAALGDAVAFAPTFPDEFRSLQAHYPIVFRKSADGALQPVALFGFEDGQNLFLDGERWDATYLPLAIERQPFDHRKGVLARSDLKKIPPRHRWRIGLRWRGVGFAHCEYRSQRRVIRSGARSRRQAAFNIGLHDRRE